MRPSPRRALLTLGALCVVLGGLVAAATGPLDWAKGSWAAAYLVLVVGVTQYVMGWMHRDRDDRDVPGWTQLAAWNVGSLLVIGGTLAATPLVVDLGSVLLVLALVLGALATRSRSGGVVLAHRAMLLVLAVSIPVGIMLSHLRN